MVCVDSNCIDCNAGPGWASGCCSLIDIAQRKHIKPQVCDNLCCVCLGVKEDSSSVVSTDEFAVYLHLPYTGHTCFLFQNEEERGHFLSALKTCIRHRNLGKMFTHTFSLWPSFVYSVCV